MATQTQDNARHRAYAERVRENLKSVVEQIIAEMNPLRKRNEGAITRESMARKKGKK